MTPVNRCNEILRLIDDVLWEQRTGGTTPGPSGRDDAIELRITFDREIVD
jgi:hypothetical protein